MKPVVDVVSVVGDLAGDVDDLRLEQRRLVGREVADPGPVVRGRVLDDALSHLVREIQAGKARISLLEYLDYSQALAVVVEAAVLLHQSVERALAGMAERRVAEVVRQGHGLRQVLVEPERARQGPRDLRRLHRVGEAGPVVVAFVVDEDLGLVLQAAEGSRMDDAVTIALVVAPASGRGLAVAASAGALRPRRVQGKVTPGHARRARRAHRRARRAAPLRR